MNLKIVQEHLKHRRMEILLRHLTHARPTQRALAFQSYKYRRAWLLPEKPNAPTLFLHKLNGQPGQNLKPCQNITNGDKCGIAGDKNESPQDRRRN